MRKTIKLKLASVALLSTAMVGCANTHMAPRASISASDTAASQVETALAKKDFTGALMHAERLVAATPSDAAARALLGRAYFANGRFASARTAFTNAITLGNVEPRTIVSLALCAIGQGDVSAARDLLLEHREHLPAADYGLAMAMANEPQEGVRALLEAVKMPDATAQTRQNLAYALALGGAWGQARLVAGQDLTAKVADRRMAQWSQLGVVNNPQQRVVALIGIAPRADDTGMPVHLALDAAMPAKVAVAQDYLVDEPQETQSVAEPVAALIAPPQLQLAPVVKAEPRAEKQAPTVPMDFAQAPLIGDPMRNAVHSALHQTRAEQIPPQPHKMVQTASLNVTPVMGRKSDWAVQLGAFNSATVAKDKWQTIRRAWPSLSMFDETYNVLALDGRTFHRLAVRGFADHAQASALCKSLKSKGQDCFVRRDAGSNVRMADSAPKAASGRPRQLIAAR